MDQEEVDFGEDTSCEGLGALRKALEAEQEGTRLYLEYGGKTNDPTGKKMFAALAADEEDHAKILSEQIERLEKGLAWCAYSPEESALEKLRPNLKTVEARKRSTEGMNDLDALRMALAQEQAAIELYRRESETLEDEQAKEMYRRLAAMEESHYDLIQAQIDYIEGTGYWFGIPEFSLEEQ
jgi:rubrerythrin